MELNLHPQTHIPLQIAFSTKVWAYIFFQTESALLEIIMLLSLGDGDSDKEEND